jgi:hypothetical protein
MRICENCGIPSDASFFDESNIVALRKPDPQDPRKEVSILKPGEELVLASYQLHRNYCGMLMSFAQFTDLAVGATPQFTTPGYQWQIRCNGHPRDPYLTFEHIINPWGYGGFPVQLRLEAGCLVELVIRYLGGDSLKQAGGRIIGRFWYNTAYGGVPNRL